MAKSPLLGQIKCEQCNSMADVRQRKAGRGIGAKLMYFAYCSHCKKMEQHNDADTQQRLAGFEPIASAVVAPVVQPEQTPFIAQETGDFNPNEPVVNPVSKPLQTPPAKKGKAAIVVGLLAMAGGLLALARA